MTTIIIAVASVLVLAGIAWLVRKTSPYEVCPVCVGVAGTWIWMLGFYFFGAPIDSLVIALLMGGSVVGIAYTLEKRLKTGQSPVVWKALFMPSGFVVAYGLLTLNWIAVLLGLAFIGVLSAVFLSGKNNQVTETKTTNGQARELEEKMKNCC